MRSILYRLAMTLGILSLSWLTPYSTFAEEENEEEKEEEECVCDQDESILEHGECVHHSKEEGEEGSSSGSETTTHPEPAPAPAPGIATIGNLSIPTGQEITAAKSQSLPATTMWHYLLFAEQDLFVSSREAGARGIPLSILLLSMDSAPTRRAGYLLDVARLRVNSVLQGFAPGDPDYDPTYETNGYLRLFPRSFSELFNYRVVFDIDNPRYLRTKFDSSTFELSNYVGNSLRSKYGHFTAFSEIATSTTTGAQDIRVGYFGYAAPYNFARSPAGLNFYTSDVNHMGGLSLGLVSPFEGALWMIRDSLIRHRMGSLTNAVLDTQNNRLLGLARGIIYRGLNEGILGARPFTRADYAIKASSLNFNEVAAEAFNRQIPTFFYTGDYTSVSATSSSGPQNLGALTNVQFFANQGFAAKDSGLGLLSGLRTESVVRRSTLLTGAGNFYGRLAEGFGINMARAGDTNSIAATGFLQLNKEALQSTTGTYTGAAVGLQLTNSLTPTFQQGTVSLTPDFALRKLTAGSVTSPALGTMTFDPASSIAVDREHLFGFQAGFDNKRFLGTMALPEFLVGTKAIKPTDLMWGTWNAVDTTATTSNFYPGLQNFWVASRSASSTAPSRVLFYDAANMGVTASGGSTPTAATNTGVSSFAINNTSGTPSVAGILYHNDGSFAIVKGSDVGSAAVTILSANTNVSLATPVASGFHGQFSGNNASSFFYDWNANAATIAYGVGVGVQTAVSTAVPSASVYSGFMLGYDTTSQTNRDALVNFEGYTSGQFKTSATLDFASAGVYESINNNLNTFVSKNAFFAGLELDAAAPTNDSYMLGIPGLEQYKYISWGLARQGDTMGFFAAGQQDAMTNASQLAALAGSGIRTYLGEAIAQHEIVGYSVSNILSGKAELVINMNTGVFTGGLYFNNNDADLLGVIALDGTMNGLTTGNTLLGTASKIGFLGSTISGDVQGALFGSNANEVMGSFSIVTPDEVVIGAFGAASK